MSADWFRVPEWCAVAEDPTEITAAVYLLGRWHLGRSPSTAELKRVTGWGWDKCDAFRRRVWDEAGSIGATRPTSLGSDTIDNGDGSLFELPGPLSHADVVARAVRWLRGHHDCRPVFAEIATYERVNPDALGFRRAWSVLVEAKVSRSDFRADRDKVIHRHPDLCPGQERWYLTPPNLLRAEEVPEGWGLAECGARSVRIVKPAPIGAPNVDRARADIGILVSAVRRHEVGAQWFDELAKFEAYDARRARSG